MTSVILLCQCAFEPSYLKTFNGMFKELYVQLFVILRTGEPPDKGDRSESGVGSSRATVAYFFA